MLSLLEDKSVSVTSAATSSGEFRPRKRITYAKECKSHCHTAEMFEKVVRDFTPVSKVSLKERSRENTS